MVDVQAVLKRITSLVQISSDELNMINDPRKGSSHRALCLARLIKEKGIGKMVYEVLHDLYCITEIMQESPSGCCNSYLHNYSNILFSQSFLRHAIVRPLVIQYPSQPMFTIIITTILL